MNDGVTLRGFVRLETDLLVRLRWGGSALVALAVSVFSGVVLALQYDVAHPFHSTLAIELLAPHGAFWRSLHFYSSQAFLLLLLIHLVLVIGQGKHHAPRLAWARLAATVPVTILLLFTGYVLRDDITGSSAGRIAEQICLAIPLAGEGCNDLLFAISSNGLKRVYVNHMVSLMLLGGWCAWDHLRRYWADWRDHLPLLCLLGGTALFVAAPMETQLPGQFHVAGPWFFLGLQELLRYLPPFWAGVVIPALAVLALLLLPDAQNDQRPWLRFLLLWLAGYAAATLVALQRG